MIYLAKFLHLDLSLQGILGKIGWPAMFMAAYFEGLNMDKVMRVSTWFLGAVFLILGIVLRATDLYQKFKRKKENGINGKTPEGNG